MRPYYLAGNWKLHKTPSEAVAYARELAEAFQDVKHRVMVAPTFVCIPQVAEVLKGSPVMVGAQNCSAAESGAHTGEVSPAMLIEAGVDVVILGHSERRAIYGETDELINQKVLLALSAGLEIILCVGETLEEREADKAMEIVKTQLKKGLQGVAAGQLDKVTIAYEPVWAIGTGKTATPQDANDIHQGAREVLAGMYSAEAADAMVIQYGGSVKPGNVKDLMSMEHIDGALVGGASLTIDNFAPIVQFDKE